MKTSIIIQVHEYKHYSKLTDLKSYISYGNRNGKFQMSILLSSLKKIKKIYTKINHLYLLLAEKLSEKGGTKGLFFYSSLQSFTITFSYSLPY